MIQNKVLAGGEAWYLYVDVDKPFSTDKYYERKQLQEQ
jgi:hypothetical protein